MKKITSSSSNKSLHRIQAAFNTISNRDKEFYKKKQLHISINSNETCIYKIFFVHYWDVYDTRKGSHKYYDNMKEQTE